MFYIRRKKLLWKSVCFLFKIIGNDFKSWLIKIRFEYKIVIKWNKQKIEMGYFSRVNNILC